MPTRHGAPDVALVVHGSESELFRNASQVRRLLPVCASGPSLTGASVAAVSQFRRVFEGPSHPEAQYRMRAGKIDRSKVYSPARFGHSFGDRHSRSNLLRNSRLGVAPNKHRHRRHGTSRWIRVEAPIGLLGAESSRLAGLGMREVEWVGIARFESALLVTWGDVLVGNGEEQGQHMVNVAVRTLRWSSSEPVAMTVNGKTIHSDSKFKTLVVHLGAEGVGALGDLSLEVFSALAQASPCPLLAQIRLVAPREGGGGPGGYIRMLELTLDTRHSAGSQRSCHP